MNFLSRFLAQPLIRPMTGPMALTLSGLALVLATPPHAIAATGGSDAITVDTRLGQRILRQGKTQKVYLRIAIKGRRDVTERERTPVNVALVIDRSGSMKGNKIAKARDAAAMAVDRLSGSDIASLVVFDDKIDTLVPARRVTSHSYFKDRIDGVYARGRTAIFGAVERAARELRKNKRRGRPSRIILMSDGQANVGPSNASAFADLGRKLGNDGITVSTIGLGRGYNEDLMAQLASASDGNHAFARTAEDLTRIFNGEFDDVLSVSAQDIEVIIETRGGVRPLRTLGRRGEIDGNETRIKVRQVYGTSATSLQVELEVDSDVAVGEIDLAEVTVKFTDKDGARHQITTNARGRFSLRDDEVQASIDPVVMEPILELEARERYERVIKLRDKGRVKEAKRVLQLNARELDAGQKRYRINSSRLKKLSERSRVQAASIEDRAKWNSSRKQMRMDQSNTYGAKQKY